jgi:hypothetical protein
MQDIDDGEMGACRGLCLGLTVAMMLGWCPPASTNHDDAPLMIAPAP